MREPIRNALFQLRWFQIGVQFNYWIDDIQQHASHRLSDHSFIFLKFIVGTNGLYLGEDAIFLRSMLYRQLQALDRKGMPFVDCRINRNGVAVWRKDMPQTITRRKD